MALDERHLLVCDLCAIAVPGRAGADDRDQWFGPHPIEVGDDCASAAPAGSSRRPTAARCPPSPSALPSSVPAFPDDPVRAVETLHPAEMCQTVTFVMAAGR
ncbi:hypothetical protein [Couchioplanes caeruleus]|uniref:Uncharacterized protein n=1 Tax=Couchioplanes caeruleus subsp. caeruleus TaxID=56427 RepID=A0A1K0GTX7_9ACTN|nr:hypothetical protein [Couchioplanes caeruleus]OJF12771.1 hypothetical protein BG844_18760 [Couchioplanes caeruleus subsp. caeruleus]